MTDGPGFDFRRPPPGDLERQAAAWLAAALKRAAAGWPKVLPFEAAPAPGGSDALTAAAALAALPADAVGFRLAAGDDAPALLALPRPLFLGLLAGLLGETPADPPADREPTAVERSLAGFLLRELFLAHLEHAWPLAEEPLALAPADAGPPRAVWRVPGEDMAVLLRMTVAAPFGEYPAALVLPRAGRFERLARPGPRPAPPEPADRAHIEALVREMSVELVAVLGEAELTMSELARLRAGDLVVLRQKVSDPLDARVGGASKFRVWPGAVGGRAAVQVDAPAGG
jgi:flagellar motor switch protein FliM